MSLAPLCAGAMLALAAFAAAAAPRTYVASYGNDSHPCSRTLPCRSFPAALANTGSGGEVIVLDSAGYGGVTIAQSVSITAPPGVYAGITVFSGDGITVNGANVVVALRGLTINGRGGANGINFVNGAELVVDRCRISHLAADAILAQATGGKVTITGSTLRNNGFAGFEASGSLDAALDGVHSDGNTVGVNVLGGSRVTVGNSVLANNASIGVQVHSLGATLAEAMVSQSIIAGAATGLVVSAPIGTTARLVSDGNAITNVSVAAFGFAHNSPIVGVETIYTANNNTVGFTSAVVSGGGSLTPCCSN
jgi:hypothetical protein